ncbi:MAG: tetratricopeptide repeat protein [Bacteroidia bacterium]
MKKFLRLVSVLFLCTVLFHSAQGQNQQKMDSLRNVLKTVRDYKSKVNCLNDLSKEFMFSDPDTALLLSNQALELAEKSKWKKGITKSMGNLGYSYFLKGTFTKSLDYLFNALKMAEELGDKNEITSDLSYIGQVYLYLGEYPKALDYCFKALKMAEEKGDKYEIAKQFSGIANVYQVKEDFPKSLEYYFKAMKLVEELGDKPLLMANYGNIGTLYARQQDYTNALDYFLRALKIENEKGNKVNIAILLGNIGQLYNLTGQYKEAEVSMKKAISLAENNGAKNDLRQFEQMLSELYDTTAQLAVGKGQFALAAEKYKLSLLHYIKAMELKDTLFNQEKNDEITRKEMNYEFDKKEAVTKAENEKQLAVADVEIKKQKLIRNFFIGGLALLLVLSFFVYNNFRTANKLKLQNIRNKIASDLHDDVGSTLNSISVYSEVAKQKSPAVVDELEQIGDASRKIIEVMSDIVWTINPKNDTFENIVSRMGTLAYNLLKAKNIEHTFQADESLNETKLSLEARRNFYLIFKEALNNLVKYSNATHASISLTSENGLIKLSVRDNGIGFDVAQTSKGNGFLNMKMRAEEMKAQLKIESEKGKGTNVELILKG